MLVATTFLIIYLFGVLHYFSRMTKSGIFFGKENHRTRKFVFLWPLEINPIELLCENLFRHYGDPGAIYFGYNGFKNFYNDLCKGKNRHKNATIKVFCFKVHMPSDHLLRSEYCKYMIVKKDKKLFYFASLIDSFDINSSFSRYELDECQPLVANQLKKDMHAIGVEQSDIDKLFLESGLTSSHH